MSGRPILSVTGLEMEFRVGNSLVRALRGVSLDVRRGETLAVVGESGSGKTTLGNIILGVMAPTAGHVALDGEAMPARRPSHLRRRLGLVQQNPYSTLNPRKTVQEAIELPLLVHGLGDRRSRRARVLELLNLVGLSPSLAHRRPLALSGGQRQRVAIARALATEPDLVLLDEPTSSLDVSVQAHILHLLRKLQVELGLTYVFITHDLGVVQVIANRVAVMYRGCVVEQGSASEIFTRPRHRYTNLLLASIPTVSDEDDRFKPDWPWNAVTERLATSTNGCAFHERCPFAVARCTSESPKLHGTDSHVHSCFVPAG
jgi:oligopeptide/dipeptide ABC transporter ATP-binding protein